MPAAPLRPREGAGPAGRFDRSMGRPVAASLHTVLSERLGCRYPIVQTAMGWIADAKLTAATCNAGGFGFLAGATIEPGGMDAPISDVKARTDRPFGGNFHMFQPNAEEVLQTA